MTKRQLTSQIKKWRTANPTGSRLAFCAYLLQIDQEPPPTGELMAAWRTYDAQRTIDQPPTPIRIKIDVDPALVNRVNNLFREIRGNLAL